ncbi:hypothetical protein [Streptomyces olivaceus]|uniref:hypothetical protein n=1 Tax=Streptomyces olivaceus TaxID=47716 RepID=UPI003635AE8C
MKGTTTYRMTAAVAFFADHYDAETPEALTSTALQRHTTAAAGLFDLYSHLPLDEDARTHAIVTFLADHYDFSTPEDLHYGRRNSHMTAATRVLFPSRLDG